MLDAVLLHLLRPPAPPGSERVTMTRVLIAGDHAFTRHCLAALVASSGDLELVGECGQGPEVFDAVRELDPQVVVTSLRTSDLPRVDTLGALETSGLGTRLLLLTSDAAAYARAAARASRAGGYVIRGGNPRVVLNAIRMLAQHSAALSGQS